MQNKTWIFGFELKRCIIQVIRINNIITAIKLFAISVIIIAQS